MPPEQTPREQHLYPPVKRLLERQGYEVKGEVGAADVVARRGDEPPVIVELKLRFSLTLFHQAIARLAITDLVYVAVPRPGGRTARRALKDNLALCRRLGLGLITVRRDGRAEVHCDPGPYAPRKSAKRQARLLRAFDRLQGDPNAGGATRHGIVTGYRQDALRCAAYLAEQGPCKGAVVAQAVQVPHATRIMADNHYGWFQRVSRGVYALSGAGSEGLKHWAYSWEQQASAGAIAVDESPNQP
ncbi:hypothetical protein I5535_13030 [Rhodobacteraceae bacterium F11138]|nr:hypothetical protein [Rhodobacteraceae bacterium F11138]